MTKWLTTPRLWLIYAAVGLSYPFIAAEVSGYGARRLLSEMFGTLAHAASLGVRIGS
jgi:hypothetical protein